MKRKLIHQEVFDAIKSKSLTNAQCELSEAQDIIADVLGLYSVTLESFGAEDVVFEASDGSYIRANYSVDDKNIKLENIEQLVIDKESVKVKGRESLKKIVEALLDKNQDLADELFEAYISGPAGKAVINEEKVLRVVPIRKQGKIVGYRKARWNVTPKHSESSSKTIARVKAKKISNRKRSSSQKNLLKLRRDRVKKTIGEWSNLCENVLNYVSLRENGPVMSQTSVQHDDKGNVVAITVPTKQLRNEAKLLSFNWKTLNTDVIVKRSGAKKLNENVEFVKAVVAAKRHNALNDGQALEESLENIATQFPSVLYLTQNELSSIVNVALETSGATNWDDDTCDFLAEGILRTAHNAYSDRVAKIIKLSGDTVTEGGIEKAVDKFAAFQTLAKNYFASLDESSKLEMQVFVDLYETIRGIHEMAEKESNKLVAQEAAAHLNTLASVIQMETESDLSLAEEAAAWLWELVETNLETSDWNVATTPFISVNGEHPDMAKKAKQGYTPANDFDGYSDVAPVSDGKNVGSGDEMRNNSWGNLGGDSPNPYIPKAGDFKMVGGDDSDGDNLGHVGGSDTWPSLSNPYSPKADVPVMND